MNKVIIEDIEIITGKCFSGDITPLVYLMLKETKDKEGLLRYLGYKEKKTKQEEPEKKPTFMDLFGNSPIIGVKNDNT